MTEEFGIHLARVANGIHPSEFRTKTAFVDAMEDDKTGSFHKQAAALAAGMYEDAGKKDHFAFHLYVKLATHQGPWSAGYTALVKPIYEALGHNKQADFNPVDTAHKGYQWMRDAYGTTLMAALATGAGAGAIGWQLGQDDVEDDMEAAKMQAQLDYLNNVTEDIDDNLRRRGVAA